MKDMSRYPIPPREHPRVYITRDRIPALRERLTAEENRYAYAYYLKCLSEEINCKLPAPPEGAARRTNASSHLLGVIECLSLSYLLDGSEANGRRAIECMLDYHSTVLHFDYNTEGQEIFTLAIVYDWCFDLLSEEEKETFYKAIQETGRRLELGYPEVKQGMIVGHGPEGQLMRDMMCAAIAVYDEHPDLYEYAAPPFFDDIIEPKKMFYASGAYPQGTHYLIYRMQWELLATQIWDALGVPRVFGDEQKAPLYWLLYLYRPDGFFFLDGDCNEGIYRFGSYMDEGVRSFFHASNYYSDPYLKREFMRQRPFRKYFGEWGNQTLNAAEYLIFNDPALEGRPRTELPLSRYFGGMKGEMIARTGWQDGSDAPAVVAQMKITDLHTSNHQHLDGGAFQIWYKGYLATDSGHYQASRAGNNFDSLSGNTVYGTQHFHNYYRRTVAHNCMLVYDPDEQFPQIQGHMIVNDGGQRFPDNYGEPRKLEELIDPARGYRMGEVLARGMGPCPVAPDYTYLKGDLSLAYSEKVSAYTRSFMFLNLKQSEHPALLFVYDRIRSSNATFRKKWLLHTLEEPQATEYGYLAADTRAYRGGQLAASILLPEKDDRYVSVIGGKGREHEVGGINFIGKRLEGDYWNEGDGYRIELSPKKGKEDDTFLVVLEPSDGGMTPLPATKIASETHTGALVGDRLVLFGNENRRYDTVRFCNPAADTVSAYVADLAPGLWQTPSGLVLVTDECGVADFKAKSGENLLVRLFETAKTPVARVSDPVPSADDAFSIMLQRDNGKVREMVYTPISKCIDGVYAADVTYLLPRLGLSAEYVGDTLICRGEGKEIRLPLREGKLVSLAGLAAALGRSGVYDEPARLYYIL